MPAKLAAHGTEAGYRAEKETGDACLKCAHAHRQYNRQFTKAGKASGVRIDRHQVIPLGETPVPGGRASVPGRRVGVPGPTPAPTIPASGPESDGDGWGGLGPVSVASRLGDALKSRLGGRDDTTSESYVDTDPIPDYLHESDPDPEPSGDWSQVAQDSKDYVINAAGMAMIEDSLGTYLSIIGITIEMIDPYCGPVLANNLDRMVKRWAKVISHYPKAAELFMDARGGVIMDWIGALQVTWPFLYALYEHHLARTVRMHDGVIERKIGDQEFRAHGGVNATMPPMPSDFQFTTGG